MDSMERTYLETWVEAGRLPHFKKLIDGGVYARLEGLEHSLAEVNQCFVFTGCRPEASGYWGLHRYDPVNYQVTEKGVYDYSRNPPFFALGPEHRVAIFDLPQYAFHPDVHGWQIAAWGAHAPVVAQSSSPPEVIGQILDRFGPHPTHVKDFAVLDDADTLDFLVDSTIRGIEVRYEVIEWILESGKWDLLLTPFAEVHKALHYLVPVDDNTHFLGDTDPLNILLKIYQKIDHVLGCLMEKYEGRMNIAVFSTEGMIQSTAEAVNVFLLPEFLLRYSFGKEGAFQFEEEHRVPSPHSLKGEKNWVMEEWNLRRRTTSFQKRLRRHLPPRAAARWERRFGIPPSPFKPQLFDWVEYQAVQWLSPYWPMMKAFALPSFSDGFIRLNVKGRESRGCVAASRFKAEREAVVRELYRLQDARTNEPIIEQIHFTRDDPFDDGPDRHPADIVVQFKHLTYDPELHHPELGQLGPAPALRSGMHSARGFFAAAGPGVTAHGETKQGHILDIAPSLLDLMRAEPPSPLEGTSLIARETVAA